jgi:octaprenyl-diphosphate synthase
VREDLCAVEKAIAIESAACAGGTRVRAALLLLCARFAGGCDSRLAIRLGAVVEMLHAASLAHGETTEGQQTRTSVLAGDWLYIRAFSVALQERVLDLVLGVAQTMVMAGLTQLDCIGRIDVTDADCIDLADRNTACLFSLCGRLGAVAAGAGARDAEKLSEFAWNVGMAFHLNQDGARARAYDFANRARQILTEFPDSACRRALFTLTDLVTDQAAK